MTGITWTQRLSVGIGFIDNDHQELVRLLYTVEQYARRNQLDRMSEALLEFRRFAGEHFAREEAAMREHGYRLLDQHTRFHRALLEELDDVCARVERSETPASTLSEFLSEWLLDHILESDKHLGGFLEGRQESGNTTRSSDSTPTS